MGSKKKRNSNRIPVHRVDEYAGQEVILREKTGDYRIYGAQYIEKGALDQMDTAMRLPVSRAGALMPDAHQGYGLPIGGVLATDPSVVIPYAVGVDIACRMCMTVFDEHPSLIRRDSGLLKQLLESHTHFGVGSTNRTHVDTTVFDRLTWSEIPIVKELRDLAYSQLGTSGAGNHFVEWGTLDIRKYDDLLRLSEGSYLALLSHSGSRGFGNALAEWFSGLAMKKTRLPQEARHLAWLSMDSEEGQEYWQAMELAGLYASANHHEIHAKIRKEFGREVLATVENHHNFAWKERLADGREVTVHRKGATPAYRHSLGIIPGSMTQDGYVVRGKGNAVSLSSASHGAGRLMSRNQAFKQLRRCDLDQYLLEKGVKLSGGDVDESPVVYKDLEKVMAAQSELVEILASFSPGIVKMAPPDKWSRKKAGLDI
ncbi:MAG TPA: RtcB family protein [Bacteroidales bacterium]|nr:RtcB family protein [Bacteroidales bacterium]HSA43631.1 RtcB family protein [Bacteroidales bacterium]